MNIGVIQSVIDTLNKRYPFLEEIHVYDSSVQGFTSFEFVFKRGYCVSTHFDVSDEIDPSHACIIADHAAMMDVRYRHAREII